MSEFDMNDFSSLVFGPDDEVTPDHVRVVDHNDEFSALNLMVWL
jgi:hypothetical protein